MFKETRIGKAVKKHEHGRNAADLNIESGTKQPSYKCIWRHHNGGVYLKEQKRMKEIKENARLKKMFATLGIL